MIRYATLSKSPGYGYARVVKGTQQSVGLVPHDSEVKKRVRPLHRRLGLALDAPVQNTCCCTSLVVRE